MMDRLTARSPKNNMAYLVKVKQDEQDVESPYPNTLRCIMDSFNRLAAYEDSGLSPEQVWELAKAKADGRLVVLPCKVGDTVYFAYPGCRKVDDAKVVGFWVSGEWLQLQLSNGSTFTCWDGPEIYFGKTVFLSREAAEKVIAEVVGDD